MKNKPLILSIDDDENVRLIFRRHLEDGGYRVIESASGEQGLEVFKKEQPDLVLTDLRMPGMDGLEVLEELKKISPDTPAIIISGSGKMADAIQALRLGAWDYLEKPIPDPSILYHAVGKNLERSRLIKQNKEFSLKIETQLQKIRADEEAGKKVQNGLMPCSTLDFGPYRFRQEILPSMYLSGDFVDFFKINTTHIGFYFADVSGHGVSSALITVLLKSFMVKYLDNYLSKSDPTILDPSTLFTALNSELLRANLDKHMTLFYGILNTTENSLLYCSAGQFPFPMIHHENTTTLLKETNLPIGLFEFSQYHNAHRILPSSFWMTLYSDGILEILQQPSLDEKLKFLTTLKSEQAEKKLLEAARKIEELPDDITILSIEKK